MIVVTRPSRYLWIVSTFRSTGRVSRNVRASSAICVPITAAERQDDAERQDHGQQHGWHAAQMQRRRRLPRGQQKGEQHCEYDRDHHLAAEIEAGDDDDRDREGQQPLHPRAFPRGRLGQGADRAGPDKSGM